MPRSASDHSSMLLHLNQGQFQPRPRFRFLNLWIDRDDFFPHIEKTWQQHAHGNPMFRLTTKLQWVKNNLRSWHKYNHSHISRRVAEAKNSWDRAQGLLDRNPMSVEFQLAEKQSAKDYQILCKDEESFYKQKSRVNWLTLGDRNTSFFHKTIMHRKHRNQIISLTDDEGNEINGKKEMGELAAEHFKGLLNGRFEMESTDRIFPSPISNDLQREISSPIMDEEIKTTLFSIPNNKAPGLDGFSAIFFQRMLGYCGGRLQGCHSLFLSSQFNAAVH